MKTKNFIIAELVKSNKSKNYVWVIYASKKDKHYAKNAQTALKVAFILKKETGCPIDDTSFRLLKYMSQSLRSDSTESPSAPADSQPTNETAPTANA